jgi:hypothetical protein
MILSLLLALFDLLGRTVPGVIDSLHRTGEMTDAEWIAAKARYEAAYTQDHWTPEGS